MHNEQIIDWNDLPHDRFVGHGVEGLVLRLNETECIKIYSPERFNNAELEFKNYQTLREKGFYVPEPKRVVRVNIKDRDARLPSKSEFFGIGLYSVPSFMQGEYVQGIVKEFIPGTPYGAKRPSIRELKRLFDFFSRLKKEGFTFNDGVPEDFISSPNGTALVDCSSLVTERFCSENGRDFQEESEGYQERVIYDLKWRLKERKKDLVLGIKLGLAKRLSKP